MEEEGGRMPRGGRKGNRGGKMVEEVCGDPHLELKMELIEI